MKTIPQRVLCNQRASALREAEAGEWFTIAVDSRPVAQLGPLPRRHAAVGGPAASGARSSGILGGAEHGEGGRALPRALSQLRWRAAVRARPGGGCAGVAAARRGLGRLSQKWCGICIFNSLESF